MRKYQWNDVTLKKKADICIWLMFGLGLVALLLLWIEAGSVLLLLVLVGAITCLLLLWKVQSDDKKLKK